jgi:hypothetical protein
MGKHPARLLTKARILLKADASEAGEGWSDSRIAQNRPHSAHGPKLTLIGIIRTRESRK